MIKLVFCLRRRPELTVDEFRNYWLHTHAQLVAERAQELGIRRYVQLHTIDAAGLHASFQRRNGGAPEPFDGIAELWFDDIDGMAATGEAARRAARELLEDERAFIDLPRSPMWIGEEHEIIAVEEQRADRP